MIVIPGRIPIIIHPLFWLCATLIAWFNSPTMQVGPFLGTLLWLGIIFVSVLFHEFGHAITAVCFKQKTNIQLVALGGVTSYEGPKLKYLRQFIIVLNGPLFGLILCALAALLQNLDWSNWPLLGRVLFLTKFANFFWSVINLIPVLPLDGGQLLRIAFESWFGLKGYKASLLVGGTISTIIALFFFLLQQVLIGALFFLFAFQSFSIWRKAKLATVQDRDEELSHHLRDAEKAFEEGRREDAERIFEEVRKKSTEGILYRAATQYLAFLKMHKNQQEDAYALLLPLEEHLDEEARCLLHQLAADHANWPLVAKLSTECYQIAQSQEVALRNARAFAFLHQPKPAGGWLQTAWRQGGLDVEKVLKEEQFQAIREDPEFQYFVHLMR